MKKCPYCAEMIQDEAIKCRYCHSDLTVAPPTSSASDPSSASSAPSAAPVAAVVTTPASAPEQTTSRGPDDPADDPTPATESGETSNVRYTHSGFRYVLGYGADFFGIWDRQSPSVPTERFPRTDDGWRNAWLRFAALEPDHTTVPGDGAGSNPAAAATSSAGTVEMDPGDTAAVQYTHSGTRYLLGYGKTFFGIWDRQAPNVPVERFARDDAGWAAAWGRYTQMEPHFTEVKLG